MSAPCVTDTCSIVSSINPVTRRLEIAARLDATGGLECGTDTDANSGLRVKLDDACGNLLTLGANGLKASGAVRSRFAATSSYLAIPHNGDEVSTQDFTVSNPFDCEAQALVLGRFETRFQASTAAAPSGYRAHLQWRFLVGGSSSAAAGSAAVHQHIGGYRNTGNPGSDTADQWSYFMGAFAWAASASKQFEVLVKHYDTGELINLDTASAGLGGQSYVHILVFPMSNATF